MSEAQTLSESSTARDLTAFQRNILMVLTEESMYGLAIKRELEDYYGEEVNHGRLYPNLDTLVERDLVGKSELDKRTNEYALTEKGLEAVKDQIAWSLSKFVTSEERAEKVRSLIESQN
ncbi:PadR family transcriptional regulator [halophilic archaeon]|nr:PadR family transcriptional regulator [halophilic archaeon]